MIVIVLVPLVLLKLYLLFLLLSNPWFWKAIGTFVVIAAGVFAIGGVIAAISIGLEEAGKDIDIGKPIAMTIVVVTVIAIVSFFGSVVATWVTDTRRGIK